MSNDIEVRLGDPIRLDLGNRVPVPINNYILLINKPTLNGKVIQGAVVIKMSDIEDDVGYLTQETDPTVPAWAKRPHKPTYSATEVGALPYDTFIPERISDLIDDSSFYTKPVDGIPASDLAAGVIPDVSGFYTKPVTGIPASDLAAGIIPDVSGFYIKPIGGIPASDIAAGVIPDVSSFYIKPIGGIPASDLAAGVIPTVPDVSGFYTKPANGIPASDIAAGVIPTVPVTDVQFNGTTILINGVANIPYAGVNRIGLVRTDSTYGIYAEEGLLKIASANLARIKAGVNDFYPITAAHQHESTFYALAKAAGVDMSGSGNEVGQYTEAGKNAIQKMLGFDGILGYYELSAIASKAYAIGETFIHNGKRYRATAAIAISDVIAPGINCELAPLDGDVYKKSDLIFNGNDYGVSVTSETKLIYIVNASEGQIKNGSGSYRPIVPGSQHKSVFYGLSKLAGVDLKNSNTPIGTYTDAAIQSIQKLFGLAGLLGPYEDDTTADRAYAIGETFVMDGKRYRATAAISQGDTITPGTNCELCPLSLSDIQLDGTSAIQNGIANIPIANNMSPGVIKIDPYYGITKTNDNKLRTNYASIDTIKAGIQYFSPLVPYTQHASTFYGLAKAAGDTTQTSSDNAIGTYTNEAKIAIQKMLGLRVPLYSETATESEEVSNTTNLEVLQGVPFDIYKEVEITVYQSDTNSGDVWSNSEMWNTVYLLNAQGYAVFGCGYINGKKPARVIVQRYPKFYKVEKISNDTTTIKIIPVSENDIEILGKTRLNIVSSTCKVGCTVNVIMRDMF